MQVSDQIIAVLDNLCAKFGMAIDWSQENVIPYVSELCEKYIQYEIATSIAWCAIMLSVTAILMLIARCGYKKEVEEIYFPFTIISGVFAVITIIVISFQVFDIIECKTIPEKTIFEYVKILLR